MDSSASSEQNDWKSPDFLKPTSLSDARPSSSAKQKVWGDGFASTSVVRLHEKLVGHVSGCLLAVIGSLPFTSTYFCH